MNRIYTFAEFGRRKLKKYGYRNLEDGERDLIREDIKKLDPRNKFSERAKLSSKYRYEDLIKEGRVRDIGNDLKPLKEDPLITQQAKRNRGLAAKKIPDSQSSNEDIVARSQHESRLWKARKKNPSTRNSEETLKRIRRENLATNKVNVWNRRSAFYEKELGDKFVLGDKDKNAKLYKEQRKLRKQNMKAKVSSVPKVPTTMGSVVTPKSPPSVSKPSSNIPKPPPSVPTTMGSVSRGATSGGGGGGGKGLAIAGLAGAGLLTTGLGIAAIRRHRKRKAEKRKM